MPDQTTEYAFEAYAEENLLTKGWKPGSNAEWGTLVKLERPHKLHHCCRHLQV